MSDNTIGSAAAEKIKLIAKIADESYRGDSKLRTKAARQMKRIAELAEDILDNSEKEK